MTRIGGNFTAWIIAVNGNTKPGNLEDKSSNINSKIVNPGDNKN